MRNRKSNNSTASEAKDATKMTKGQCPENYMSSFILSWPTILVTVVRIGCLLPKNAFFSAIGGSSSMMEWLLHNQDLAPIWTSMFIRPYETWNHVREAQAVREIFGVSGSSSMQSIYGSTGCSNSYVHLPPLVLAVIEPIMDQVRHWCAGGYESPWYHFAIGVIPHLIDLMIAAVFLYLGKRLLVDEDSIFRRSNTNAWEEELQPKVPTAIQPVLANVFPTTFTTATGGYPRPQNDDTATHSDDSTVAVTNASVESRSNSENPDNDETAPVLAMADLPVLAAQLYYYSPVTALASGLGTTHHCFQNIWLFFLLLAFVEATRPQNASVSQTTLWLALGAYMEVHYVAHLIPLSLIFHSRSGEGVRKIPIALVLFFVFWVACLQGLSMMLVGNSQYVDMLKASYGHVMTWKHLHPNFSVLWYFNMELFERFRTYFVVLINGVPYLVLLPLTLRLYRYPMVVATNIWMIWTILRPISTLVDVNIALCWIILCPRSLVRMRPVTLAISTCSLFVPVTLYVVTLWLWLEPGSGEANFTFFQCLAYNAFLSAFFVEFCGASVRRDKALRMTEKMIQSGTLHEVGGGGSQKSEAS